MCFFCNYHKHTHESNIYVPDSPVTIMDYVHRSKELDHKILASIEHGYQGRYLNTYDVAKKNGLKFIFGTEAYWVKNRFDKDKTNAHICLFAKSEKGRRDINRILSEANISGYYYRPRVDLNLLSTLDPNEVFITSACIAFWHYEDIEEIVQKFKSYFGKNFMFEVQAHNTEPQKNLHRRILELSQKYDIDLIAGCDSHFIYPEQSADRDDVLAASKIFYEDEVGWYMDYPDGETLFKRFQEQGVLTNDQIKTAIKNTHVFLDFDDYDENKIKVFSKDIKLPSIYPELTQEEKNEKYKQLLNQQWKIHREKIPREQHGQHLEEIRKEGQVIINTGMADYFLLDYEIVKDAVTNGGQITSTGRGSGVSFYTNTLLGFSKVNRVTAPVKLYPERFISESRILETKSLPDLDLNLGNVEVFAKSQEKILGEGHSYPMMAFGTFKRKSAFKMYARAKNLDFEIANIISKQLEDYEKDLKYAEDDEKDLIDVYDYVDGKYHGLIKDSEKYSGIISDKKPHPCAYLLYQGDIKEEIGLIKLKSESTGKEVLAALMDGDIAEKFKFLKNDLLKVDVVKLNYKIYERIGIEVHTEQELLDIIRDNQKVWDIYENGYTIGINQVEKYSTTQKVKKYKPKNISELTAFIAAIRPSFKSMYSIFESRKPFSYNIPNFDSILQTEEMPNSFVLYQEQMMATLAYAEFPSDETYGIIKAISKKKPEEVIPLEERFLKEFSKRIISEQNSSQEEASLMSKKVWTIIEDSVDYGFNASHAYSVALDSAYGAYLKSHYPIYFYETMLRHFTEKKNNKEKIAKLKTEMKKAFNIIDGGIKFRKDNRGFVADEENNTIFADLSSIKFMSSNVAEDLFDAKDKLFETFIDLLVYLTEKTCLNIRNIEILIRLNYFSEFGRTNELVSIFNEFSSGKDQYKKTYVEKTKIKRLENLRTTESEIKQNLLKKDLPPQTLVMFQKEVMGYSDLKYENLNEYYGVIVEIDTTYSPKLTVYNLQNGEEEIIKMNKKLFKKSGLEIGYLIKNLNIELKNKKKPDGNGDFIETEDIEPWLVGCTICN
ncbi:PHP domain-containing protein [Paenibacillus sp. GCM10027627]|uniref:PHP domain-containing protein n=1 Tax=unclassified Paenibacillus TaxID=185978 RepID=UPI003643154E